jgi:hypothetical protein
VQELLLAGAARGERVQGAASAPPSADQRMVLLPCYNCPAQHAGRIAMVLPYSGTWMKVRLLAGPDAGAVVSWRTKSVRHATKTDLAALLGMPLDAVAQSSAAHGEQGPEGDGGDKGDSDRTHDSERASSVQLSISFF